MHVAVSFYQFGCHKDDGGRGMASSENLYLT